MRTALIKTDIWDNDAFYELNIDTKLIYLLLLSNPERQLTNIYKSNDRLLSARSGLNSAQIAICKRQLEDNNLVLFRDSYVILQYSNLIKPTTGKLTERLVKKQINDLPINLLTFLDAGFFNLLTKEQREQQIKTAIIVEQKSSGAAPVLLQNGSGVVNDNVNEYVSDTSNSNTVEPSIVAKRGRAVDIYKTEVANLMLYWKDVMGYPIEQKLPSNRRDCALLVKQYGIATVQALIRAAYAAQTEEYAPRISDFVELKDKLVRLRIWIKRYEKKSQQTNVEII